MTSTIKRLLADYLKAQKTPIVIASCGLHIATCEVNQPKAFYFIVIINLTTVHASE